MSNKLFRMKKEKLFNVIVHAYRNADIELIEYILNNEQLKNNLHTSYNIQPFQYVALEHAAISENKKVLDYMIEDKFNLLNISENKFNHFIEVIYKLTKLDKLSSIKKIARLLNEPIEKANFLPVSVFGQILVSCANNIQLIEYFLTDTVWQKVIDNKEVNIESIAESAYRRSHFDTVKCLLSSPKLSYHSPPNYLFLQSLLRKNQEMINYFIFDYEIKNDEFLQKTIIELKCPEINDLMKQRELKKKLETSLNNEREDRKPQFKL